MLSRRVFLNRLGMSAAGLLLAEQVFADPYAPVTVPTPTPFKPVRIRGQVLLDGRPMANVGITDGMSVVGTDADGVYELISSNQRRFVQTILPAGTAVPLQAPGTARLFRTIAPDPRSEACADFHLESLAMPDDRHAFLLLADNQTIDEQEIEMLHAETVPSVRRTVGELGDRPVFTVACGDIMYDRLDLYPGYERAVKAMGVPGFQVLGNHDCEILSRTDAASTATFEQHFGPAYYSFNRGEIHYVVLDDVFWHGSYFGYLTQAQLDWLAADLARVEAGRTVVVFVHIPPYCTDHERAGESGPSSRVVIVNRDLLYRALEPYRAHVICGHMHECEFIRDGGVDIHVCGAVSGAWWTGPICFDGTPSGYGVYEVDGADLRWRYQSTGKPVDHQMRLYRPGAVAEAQDAVLANVFAADEHWQVVWFADGQPQGAMTRHRGRDPLSVELHDGPDKPHKSWVNPIVTDHLFLASPTPGTREIRVEATDRFGRMYSETIIL